MDKEQKKRLEEIRNGHYSDEPEIEARVKAALEGKDD